MYKYYNPNPNIAIPEGGTVGPISISLAIDGEPIPTSRAIVTPAAAGDYFLMLPVQRSLLCRRDAALMCPLRTLPKAQHRRQLRRLPLLCRTPI